MFISVQLNFGRVAYGFYALSFVSRGMGKFEDAIRTSMFQLCGKTSIRTLSYVNDLKDIRQRLRFLKSINLSIGPYWVQRDIAVQGSFFYVNNYATAALWPRD